MGWRVSKAWNLTREYVVKVVQVETDTTLTLEVGYGGSKRSVLLTMARRESAGSSWVMASGVTQMTGGKACRW